MLKKFSLKNYKNFKDEICIDFENIAGYQFSTDCIFNGVISKMLIYGRNATGKTNLGKAVMDINRTLFAGVYYAESGVFLNADSTEKFATFCYTFQFQNKEVVYRYSKISEAELCNEELLIDGKYIFRCDYQNKKYNFDNLREIEAETANVKRYLQALESDVDEEFFTVSMPFLRWLISNVAFAKDSVLISLSNYVGRMIMMSANSSGLGLTRTRADNFFEYLNEKEHLQDFEEFLNAMGINCTLVLKKLPDDRKELYFKHDKLIPFYANASSGTLNLVNLYRKIIMSVWEASFIYLDEFDAFYHYEMAESVIQYFKTRFPKTQMIMTSHNTNLMTNRLIRPDCLFILSLMGTLTALCNATQRELREGHNLEKMYISGEFEKYE